MIQGCFIIVPVMGQSMISSITSQSRSSSSQLTTDQLTGCSWVSWISSFLKFQFQVFVMKRAARAPAAKMASFLIMGPNSYAFDIVKNSKMIIEKIMYCKALQFNLLSFSFEPHHSIYKQRADMLVKRVGHVLIIKSKAYKIIAILAPILMLASILLLAAVPWITEEFKFQQPALKTKLFTLEPRIEGKIEMEYEQVFPGVKLAMIEGRLARESVILVSKCNSEGDQKGNEVFQGVYDHISRSNRKEKRLRAKNIGFLCYNASQSIHKFMEYQTGNLNSVQLQPFQRQNRLGIIRNALILQLNSPAKKRKSSSVNFNIYSPGSEIHTDVDFYQAIKELLQQVGISKWQPCRHLEQSKFLRRVARLGSKRPWSLAFKHSLCQLYEIIWNGEKNQVNINGVFQQNGVQAATLEANYLNDDEEMIKRLTRLTISFVEQFVVFEDHLHSSSTIFLPLNQSHYLPIKALIIPGIAFLIVTAAHLIIKVLKLLNSTAVIPMDEYEDYEAKLLESSLIATTSKPSPIVFLLLSALYCSSFQFYFNSSVVISLLPLAIVRLFIKERLSHRQQEFVRIVLSGICIFICEYYAVFCLPLCILTIIQTNLICFASRKVCLAFILGILLALMYFSEIQYFEFVSNLLSLSIYAQIALYPLLLWIFIV